MFPSPGGSQHQPISFVKELTTKSKILISPSSDVSVWPASQKEKRRSSGDPGSVQDLWGTPMPCYGTKVVAVNLENSLVPAGHPITFRLADVAMPVLGKDFLDGVPLERVRAASRTKIIKSTK